MSTETQEEGTTAFDKLMDMALELQEAKAERDEARETAVRWGKSSEEQFKRAERAESTLGVAETEIICLNKRVADLQALLSTAGKALEPFADAAVACGDTMAVDTSLISYDALATAYHALSAIRAKDGSDA